MGDLQIDLRLLHGFEKGPLNASPRHIGTYEVDAGRDLVDFINVNDPILSPFDIPLGFIYQISHQVLHIASNIPGLAEFCRIPLHKGNPDLFGNQFD